MSSPLGIGLGIDFASLDSDLKKVAERIEGVGAKSTMRVGTLSGLAAPEKDGKATDELGSQVEHIGVRLSQGMNAGVTASNVMMMAFGAQMNNMLNRLTETTVKMFERIDAAMKFPVWDATLSRLHMDLASVGNSGQKEGTKLARGIWGPLQNLSNKMRSLFKRDPIATALGGGMGKTEQKLTMIFQALFQDLGRAMSASMEPQIDKLVKAFGEAATSIKGAMVEATAFIGLEMMNMLDKIEGRLKRMGSSAGRAAADVSGIMAGAPKAAAAPRFGAFPTGPVGGWARGKGLPPLPAAMAPGFVGPQLPVPPTPPAKPPSRRPLGARTLAPTPAPFVGPPQFVGPPAPPKKVAAPSEWQEMLKGVKTVAAAFSSVLKPAIAGVGVAWDAVDGVVTKTFNAFFRITGKAVMDTVRFGADILNIGVLATRAYTRITNAVSSWGSVSKKTYVSLFRDHNLLVASLLTIAKTTVHIIKGLYDLVTLRAFRRVGDDAKSANTSINQTVGAVGKLIGSVGRLGVEIGAAFGLIGLIYKAVGFFTEGTKAASNLNETVSASKVIFGDSFGEVNKQAESLQSSYSILKGEQLEVAQGFGAMAVGAGFSQQQAAKLANEMTGLAANLSSSKGAAILPFREAAEKLQSALAGESEPLRRFGADVTDVAVKAKVGQIQTGKLAGSMFDMAKAGDATKKMVAGVDFGKKFGKQSEIAQEHSRNAAKHAETVAMRMAMAAKHAVPIVPIKKRLAAAGAPVAPADVLPGKATEDQLKMAGRAQVMIEKLKYAEGDLARTADSASNQFKKAGGGVEVFAEKAGEILLPIVRAATIGFNALLGEALGFLDKTGPVLASWAGEVTGWVNTVIEGTKTFGPTILANLTWVWGEAKKGPLGFVIEAAETVFEFAKAIPEMIGIAVRNADTLWEIAKLKVGDFANNAIAFMRTIPDNFDIIWPWIKKNWLSLLTDMLNGMATFATNLATNAANLGKAVWEALRTGEFNFSWTPLMEGFEAQTEKMPELIKAKLTSSQAEIDKLYEKIGQKEIARPKFKAEEAKPGTPSPVAPKGADVTKEYKLASAIEIDSKEAASIVAKNASMQGIGPAKEAVNVAKSQDKKLQQIVDNTKPKDAKNIPVKMK